VFVQASGSSTVTNATGGFIGSVSGRTLTLKGSEGSYTFTEVLTLSANGNSYEGPDKDSNGTSGTVTAVRVGALASLDVSLSTTLSKNTVVVGSSANITVTLTAGGGDLTGLTLAELTSSSDAAVVGSGPSGLSGFSLAADASRSFTFVVKGAKEGTTTLNESASGQSSSGVVNGSGTLDLKVGPPQYLITMKSRTRTVKEGYPAGPVGPTKLATGDTVSYGLEGWDPNGGPISISWDHKEISQLSVKSDGSSEGEFEIKPFDWPVRGTVSAPQECSGDLVAKQGDVERTLTLGSPVQGAIIFNEDTSFPLKDGDLYCDGETPPRISSGALVYSAPDALDEYAHVDELDAYAKSPGFPVVIEDSERNINVDFAEAYFHRLICTRLSGSRWLQISVPSPGKIQSAVTDSACQPRPLLGLNPLLEQHNNKDANGVANINSAESHIYFVPTYDYYVPESQNLDVQEECSYATAYVVGDLKLGDGLSGGDCSLYTTGNLTIKGTTNDLYSEKGEKSDVGQVVWANGDLILWGSYQIGDS
jgi:hypothetical protein